MSLTREQVDELFERSKNDRAIIVGSEVRQLCVLARKSFNARDEALEEVVSTLGDRLESLRIMTDRAGYTREGNDLSQRSSATYDAIQLVRALKGTK